MDSVTVNSATTATSVPPTISVIEEKPAELLSLEQLVKIGRVEEVVEIASFKFKLVTLSSAENTEVISLTSNIKEDDMRFGALRYEILARAVESVNDVPFESFYKGAETGKIKKREQVLKLLQQTVVNSLWEAYDKVVAKSVEMTKVEGTALKN